MVKSEPLLKALMDEEAGQPMNDWALLHTPRFKNCVIGGCPLHNYQITPFLVETDQMAQVTFTDQGRPNKSRSDWARLVELSSYFTTPKQVEWEGYRVYKLRLAAEGVETPHTMGLKRPPEPDYDKDNRAKNVVLTGPCGFPPHPPSPHSTRELDMWQCLTMVGQMKAEGNELMKAGFLTQAQYVYSDATERAKLQLQDRLFITAEGQPVIRHPLQVSLQEECVRVSNNLGLCLLKQKDWDHAELFCTVALDMDPDNVKALYRRAQANIELGKHDEAERDLQHASKLDPEEKGVARLLALCEKKRRIA